MCNRNLGEVPEDWRKANITLIFEKVKKEYEGNYRPVGLTSVPEKATEQVLGNFSRHMQDKKVIMDSPRRSHV